MIFWYSSHYVESHSLNMYAKLPSGRRHNVWSEPFIYFKLLGRLAQSVMCLATDASLTADPGVASLIPVWSHTFVEIDNEIISTVVLLPSAESFKKGCCQLQVKVCARSTGQLLVQACPGKSVVRRTDRPAMTIAVDLGRKATKQTNKIIYFNTFCMQAAMALGNCMNVHVCLSLHWSHM